MQAFGEDIYLYLHFIYHIYYFIRLLKIIFCLFFSILLTHLRRSRSINRETLLRIFRALVRGSVV